MRRINTPLVLREGSMRVYIYTVRAQKVEELRDFHCSFRGEKYQRERESLEDLASNLPDTDDVCDFLQSSTVSKVCDQCCSELIKTPNRSLYNKALAIVPGRLLFW